MFITICTLNAQTFDDFEDGDFTQNPNWTGDQQYFIVNASNQLQLNDDDENSSYLATLVNMTEDFEWRCWIKLGFSPSSNNNARYYLISDKQNLKDSLNGYYLQLGESGSDDAIELFRQDGTEVVSVCRGIEGTISSSFEIRVKVTREADGEWRVFADHNGGEDFVLEAEGVDNIYPQSSHIGFVCNYTKSNSAKMYFDDVYAGPIIIDNEPPELVSAVAETDSSVVLTFDEAISLESSLIVSNYFVDNGIGNPIQASHNEFDKAVINLYFATTFELGTNYLIDVSGIRDLAENIMEPTQLEFSYYRPQPYDIVINEIMADPTPTVGLPEYEYLELYNRTTSTIDLDGWTLIIGTSEKEFSSKAILPGGYLILAKELAYYDFIDYGDFYGFSSFSLTNSGQIIELVSKEGVVISAISYSSNWYHNPEKEEGGWSIEQKNPDNICSGDENWTASTNVLGGSPGSINSVANDIILLPELKKLEIITENNLQLIFNQSMSAESLNNKDMYIVDDGIFPTHVYTYNDDPSKVDLYFENDFQKGLLYELTLNNLLANCMQLNLERDTVVVFGLPEKAEIYNLVINEILFNPWTGGEDYVELFNRTEKIIDLSELQIGSIKTSPPNPPDTSLYSISAQQKLLLPNDFIVLTVSPDAVKNQYYTSNPNAFMEVDPFPSFNNDNGHVFLISSDNIIIDSFSYSENLHFPLLVYHDGIALEKNNPNVNISNNSNWHSAAESVGFGTPGYENSQYVSQNLGTEAITIEPEIFSPDNDGSDDIINIVYNFDKPGYVMSVIIYNSNGFSVRKLVNNEYLGTAGTISWDGIQDDNSKAPVGIYIFYITVFDMDGNVDKYKKVGVLATNL